MVGKEYGEGRMKIQRGNGGHKEGVEGTKKE